MVVFTCNLDSFILNGDGGDSETKRLKKMYQLLLRLCGNIHVRTHNKSFEHDLNAP